MAFDWCDQGPHICIDAYCPVLLLLEHLVYFHQVTTVTTILFPLYGRAKNLPVKMGTLPSFLSATGREKGKCLGSFPEENTEMTSASSVVQGYRNSERHMEFFYTDLQNTALWQVQRQNRNGLSSPSEVVITTDKKYKVNLNTWCGDILPSFSLRLLSLNIHDYSNQIHQNSMQQAHNWSLTPACVLDDKKHVGKDLLLLCLKLEFLFSALILVIHDMGASVLTQLSN